MVVGSGVGWGESYSAAMCIMEEMLWMKTKSIHGAEFFHGTIELVEQDTSMLLIYSDDETRHLMQRVYDFASTISKDITVLDTKEVELPVDNHLRKYLSPIVIGIMIDRLAVHLSKEKDHPLTIRRYYRQMEY
jgi:fructoselysine-6-phosphate deglycase